MKSRSGRLATRTPAGPASIVILRLVDAAAHDLADLFSPPRFTDHAGFFGLRPGEAFDLTDGLDLGTAHGRARVWAYLKAHRPRCVVVSPPCTTFSRLMAICRGRMPPGKLEQHNVKGQRSVVLRSVSV